MYFSKIKKNYKTNQTNKKMIDFQMKIFGVKNHIYLTKHILQDEPSSLQPND